MIKKIIIAVGLAAMCSTTAAAANNCEYPTRSGIYYGHGTVTQHNDSKYYICQDGVWFNDYSKIVVDNALVYCTGTVYIYVTKELKRMCDGKNYCAGALPASIVPPDWTARCGGTHAITKFTTNYHCSKNNAAIQGSKTERTVAFKDAPELICTKYD